MKQNNNIDTSRREFLKLCLRVGGAAMYASLLNACARAGLVEQTGELVTPTITASPEAISSPTTVASPTTSEAPSPTSEPDPTETSAPATAETRDDDVARVALVKTMERSGGVRRAVELLGINPAAGVDVLLKPNFNSADPAPGSTHPDVLRTLVTLLGEMGATGITVGDRSGMGDTRAVMRSLGVEAMAEELGFDLLVFDDLPADSWVEFRPVGSHWKQGFLLAAPCLDCGALVQTCCLKTHRFGGVFTLSLKNSVGMAAKYHPKTRYNYMSELHTTLHQRRMIAEINAAYSPDLVVMDGVEAFVSGGPDRGQLATPGVVLAGTDRIAIDAIGVAILRQHGADLRGAIFEQEQIARAVELGLGVDDPGKIEFITGDAESAAYAEQLQQAMF